MHMKSVKTLLVTMALAVSGSFGAYAQLTASDAFVSAPAAVFPLLNNSTRLDMIDYFNSGSSTTSTNALKGKSRIVSLETSKLSIDMTDASSYELVILPKKGGGSLIGLISTVATPAPDSNLGVYSDDWKSNITETVFKKPVLVDWLSAEGKKNKDEVEMLVPFLLISYDFDPKSGVLTLTNNTKQFLSEDVYSIVSPYFLPSLKYKWDGKAFSALK